MKKIIITLLSFLAILQFSCNPIEEDHKQGSVIAESELDLEVYPLTEGGNKIVMINKTPKIGAHWNYGSGISTISGRERNCLYGDLFRRNYYD